MSVAASRLRFIERDGRTVLVERYVDLPLSIQRPLRGPAGQAVVVMLTPAGALFEDDNFTLEVWCGPLTDVTLTTVAATKLNRCDRRGISVGLDVHVADGAQFRYVPHELIAFRGANYRQRIAVDLAGTARADLLDVFAPRAIPERFAFTRLAFETSVRRDGRLVARERAEVTPQTAGVPAGFSHWGSRLVFDARRDGASTARLNEQLACQVSDGVAGASTLPNGQGMCVRMLGTSAHAIRAALLTAPPPPPWLHALLPP